MNALVFDEGSGLCFRGVYAFVMSVPRRTIVVAMLGAIVLAGVVVMRMGRSEPAAAPISRSTDDGQTHDESTESGGKVARGIGAKTLPNDHGDLQEAAMPAARIESGSPQLPVPPAATEKARYQPGPSKYRSAKRPEARTVLAKVGSDFEAEALWLQSINDPSVPANERKDLIEDLNEDGLSNPARPSREDLALIKSRIQLVDRLLPSAIDQVNEEAFREARKDLLKMRDRLEE